MTDIKRVSAGVPTGGRFAATSHAESAVSLAAPVAAQPDPDVDVDVDTVLDEVQAAHEQRDRDLVSLGQEADATGDYAAYSSALDRLEVEADSDLARLAAVESQLSRQSLPTAPLTEEGAAAARRTQAEQIVGAMAQWCKTGTSKDLDLVESLVAQARQQTQPAFWVVSGETEHRMVSF